MSEHNPNDTKWLPVDPEDTGRLLQSENAEPVMGELPAAANSSEEQASKLVDACNAGKVDGSFWKLPGRSPDSDVLRTKSTGSVSLRLGEKEHLLVGLPTVDGTGVQYIEVAISDIPKPEVTGDGKIRLPALRIGRNPQSALPDGAREIPVNQLKKVGDPSTSRQQVVVRPYAVFSDNGGPVKVSACGENPTLVGVVGGEWVDRDARTEVLNLGALAVTEQLPKPPEHK